MTLGFEATPLTADQVLNLYLYGAASTPADLLSANLVRSADAEATIFSVSRASYITEGPGRFANPSRFDVVQSFFSGDLTSAIDQDLIEFGRQYTEDEIESILEQVSGRTFSRIIELDQKLFADDIDDYAERVLIWNNTAFEIDETTARFVVNADGTREIVNFRVKEFVNPGTFENFDLNGGDTLTNIANVFLEDRIDPSGIGRKVNFIFIDDYQAYTYTSNSYINDLLTVVQSSSSNQLRLPEILDLTESVFNNDGAIRFLDGIERVVVYGSIGDDTLIGTQAKNIDVANQAFLQDFVQNGVAYVAGEGNDIVTATEADDRLLTGAGDDLLSGGAGNDELDGGNGVDTADYSSEVGSNGITVLALPIQPPFSLPNFEVTDTYGDVDTLISIEVLIASNGTDVIDLDGFTGSIGIDGGGGNDTLTGGTGGDSLFGGEGIDSVAGGDGADILGNLRPASFDYAALSQSERQALIATEFLDTEIVIQLDGGLGDDIYLIDVSQEYGETNVHWNFFFDQDAGTKLFVRNIDTGFIDAVGGGITTFAFLNPGSPGNMENPEDPIPGSDPMAHYHHGFVSDSGAFYYIGMTVDEGLDTSTTNLSLMRYSSIEQFLSVIGIGFGSPDGGAPLIQASFSDPNGGPNSVGLSVADLVKGTLSDLGLDDDETAEDEPTPSGLIAGVSLMQSGFGQPLNVSGTAAADFVVATAAGASVVASLGGGDDTLKSGSGADSIVGGHGNDLLEAGEGADSLDGGLGFDSLDGGDGVDAADYSTRSGGVSVNLFSGTATTGGSLNASGFYSGGALEDTLTLIENILGTAFGDRLVGANVASVIHAGGGGDRVSGFAGADLFWGEAGNDTLEGGDGADTLVGAAGNDSLNGGAGADTIDYSEKTGGVSVNLVNNVVITGGALNAGGFYQGGANEDTLAAIENAIGSAYGDRLVGASAGSFLSGAGGNDRISGVAGADSLHGGSATDTLEGADGADTLNGGTGYDTLDGGANTDTADYSDRTGGVNINLTNGTGITGGSLNASGTYVGGFTEDSLIAVENVTGSDFGDRLVGVSAGSRLEGRGGNDNISGLSGADTLVGGAGNDTLGGGAGNDTFEFASGFGADRITDLAEGAGAGDVIRLVGLGAAFNSFAEVIAAASQSGGDVVFNFGGGNTITVASATVAGFAADDFTFG